MSAAVPPACPAISPLNSAELAAEELLMELPDRTAIQAYIATIAAAMVPTR